ncbi:MAG TPA: hypothetical protein VFR68_03070 [Candidatus Dormibacteraeota bacterium]|nr:hypothetical protein [Candidatus Dormibacteraeota bacterium]
MSRAARWARWSVIGSAMILLLWVAALIGGLSPELRRLTINVHGPAVADYRADSPLSLAPLSPDVTTDASRDQASRGTNASPSPGGSASPAPSGTGGQPTPTIPGTPSTGPSLPTLPVSTPTLPVSTPTLPVATPTLPTAIPTVVQAPTLPTPPPLP